MKNTPQTDRFVVLATVDGSPLEQEVVRDAANFRTIIAGGELHLLHVVEDLPPPLPPLVPAPVGLGISTAELVGTARKHLDELAAEARTRFGGRIVEHLAAGSAGSNPSGSDRPSGGRPARWHARTRRDQARAARFGGRDRGAQGIVPGDVVRQKDYHAFVPPGNRTGMPGLPAQATRHERGDPLVRPSWRRGRATARPLRGAHRLMVAGVGGLDAPPSGGRRESVSRATTQPSSSTTGSARARSRTMRSTAAARGAASWTGLTRHAELARAVWPGFPSRLLCGDQTHEPPSVVHDERHRGSLLFE